jgi:hypothetical protein
MGIFALLDPGNEYGPPLVLMQDPDKRMFSRD